MTELATPSVIICDDLGPHIDDLVELLHASVHAGASIGFALPFSEQDSAAFWQETVGSTVMAGHTILLLAHCDEKVVGSVQLGCDTPANQPHRADVKKLLVHPAWRRRGIARVLMIEIERHAKALGRRLLTLDTRTGDQAEPLYRSLGYEIAGIIPDFCVDTIDQTRLDPTTVMYKRLQTS